MSIDKRSVKTDALDTLGMVIDDLQKRDAIHLAVEPVVAARKLHPGQDVGLVNGMADISDKPIGIVDPFLKGPVAKGDRFWLVVYPRQITSLRHVWTHPDIPETAAATPREVLVKQASEAWLRNFVETNDCPDYETLIAKALDNGDSWDPAYLAFNGVDAHGDIPPEFWDHVEVVTGKKIPRQARAQYFSCSC